jgi:hypothetical protein
MKPAPILTSHFLALIDLSQIGLNTADKYIRRHGKFTLDPEIFPDLWETTVGFLAFGQGTVAPGMDRKKAGDFALELRERGFVGSKEINEYFGIQE